jgi:hypothetical protein
MLEREIDVALGPVDQGGDGPLADAGIDRPGDRLERHAAREVAHAAIR